jgi:ubiquitin-protein ligase E3 C
MEFHVLRDNIDIMSLLQEAKESKSRASTLLSAAPCLVPFEVRVHAFMDARKRDRQTSGVGYAGIRVRRGNLLEDGMNALSAKLTESLEGIIRVQFVNEQGLDEAGVDGGGLFKDFLNDLITEAFDPKFGLFVETPERTLYPNPASEIHAGAKHLQYFYFLGAILGKAAYEGILLDVPLAGFFLAALKGGHVEFNDLTTLDPELYRNLVSLKRYPGDVRDLCLYFTAIDRSGMDEQEIELIPHGSSIEVTNANVPRYIHCMSQFLLRAQIHRQIACFVSGFEIMMRKRWLNMFTPAELRLLISGNRTGSMDIADMAAHCEYSGGYAPDHPVIRTFWNVMREITPDEQRQVLKFITSCSNTPLLGFSHLEPRLVIHRSGTAGSEAADSTADLTRLPTAATCMNLLKLPPYTSKDALKSKLLYAVQSNSGFDLS